MRGTVTWGDQGTANKPAVQVDSRAPGRGSGLRFLFACSRWSVARSPSPGSWMAARTVEFGLLKAPQYTCTGVHRARHTKKARRRVLVACVHV